MKRITKLSSILLASSIILGGFALPTSADTTQHLWDEATNSILDISILNEKGGDETTNLNENTYVGGSVNKGEITPLWEYKELVRYDQTGYYINPEQKYVGIFIVDNRENLYSPASMTYEAEYSDSWGIEGNLAVGGSAEKNLVVAKVNATVTLGGSINRSWTKGTKYGTSTSVPAKMRGAAIAYIPGVSSNGKMVYKVTTDSTGEVRYVNEPVGAVVPSKSAWNVKLVVPYNQ